MAIIKTAKTAVIGVGYLGQFHAEKYKNLPQSQLIAVCDNDPARAAEIAAKLRVKAVTDYRDLIGLVDAVSIAVPTAQHHTVGQFFLSQGIHVLMEKPITTTLEQAADLIALAKKNQLILQVGHIERFNPAITAIIPNIKKPYLIESTRLAPFKLRGSDISVILDLMIHDIDLIQSIVRDKISHITANGAVVLSSEIDTARACITFNNGCVANITTNRVSDKTARSMRIFQENKHFDIDLNQKFENRDALQDQIAAFLEAIIQQRSPLVSGEDGFSALRTALEITRIINTAISV